MKGFLPLFLHEYKKPSFNSKYKYMDASDGIAYTRTLKEMEENFKRLYPDNEENKPIMINFVLSQFLDGVQIWKKSVTHFAPYLINVLNLPHTYRGKLGLGMFLISLITCKANSGAEKLYWNFVYFRNLKGLKMDKL
jgi:hypothetical protein